MANLDGSGLSEVWVRAAQLVKRFTGAVNLTKGDLQTQVDTKITGTAISNSSAITTEGEYALDAREKNASVDGTLANQISNLNSNLENGLATKAGKDQISNPNLLDNPWFNVNSRGQSEYAPATASAKRMHIVDKWEAYFWNSTLLRSINIIDDGIELITQVPSDTNNNSLVLHQNLSKNAVNSLKGREVTISAIVNRKIANDSLRLFIFISNDNGNTYRTYIGITPRTFNTFELISRSRVIPEDTTNMYIEIGYNTNTGGAPGNHHCIIKSMKLELGSISTLHLDSAPDIEQERLKCMLSTTDNTDTYANKGALTEDLWNSTKTYAVGEYCIWNGSMWKCLVENSGIEPTEGDTWTATSISAELASIISKIDALSA